MREKLRVLYLDYVNNFLTVARFAEYYSLQNAKALKIIDLGRKLHERRVK
jgi:hypothetical protein